MKFALSLLVVLLIGLSSAAKYSRTVSYEGEIVIRCGLQEERIKDLLSNDRVDVWKVTADHADIRLHKKMFNRIRGKFPECSVLHSDVERLVQEFEQEIEKSVPVNGSLDWHEEYHSYDEIVSWYKDLKPDNPDISIEFKDSIGKSYEGRDQPAVHFTSTKGSTNKLQIYFQCQIHAREWISGANCMYIADNLVNPKGSDIDRVNKILEEVEFIFVPLANPDGYEFSRNGDRLWRKNRAVNAGSSCLGVDLNRNYNNHWAEEGSSSNPCSETYHGPSAASEPETQNTQNYFKENKRIIGANDWHSFSQLILRPWGWTTEPARDELELSNIGNAVRDAIEAVHGKKYTPQRVVDLYKASGGASDWFYGNDANEFNEYRAAGITIELRDTGQYGFLLPASEIIPTGEENLQGMLVFTEMLVENPLSK